MVILGQQLILKRASASRPSGELNDDDFAKAGTKTMVISVQQVVRERLTAGAARARALFKDAVRPIYGSDRGGKPFLIGSSILLEIGEQRLILTAAHCIDWNVETKLYIGGSKGLNELSSNE
jgi:hypothetical protein